MKIGLIHILTDKALKKKLKDARILDSKMAEMLLNENHVLGDYYQTLPTKYRPDIKRLKAKAKREAKVKTSDTGTV